MGRPVSRRQFTTRDGRTLAKPGRYANAVRSHCRHLRYRPCRIEDCPLGPGVHYEHDPIIPTEGEPDHD